MILKEDVIAQLRRIVNSSPITNSTVLTDFLTFVVTETLGGRGESLKEYTIGVTALRKDSDFNPQLDSIVRIHAGRLRRALKEYYYEDGKDDPVLISIPKGSYAPLFKLKSDDIPFLPLRVEGSETEAFDYAKSTRTNHYSLPSDFGIQNKPVLMVLPFKNIGSEKEVRFFATGLGEHLSTELTHFQLVNIISVHRDQHPKNQGDSPDASKPNAADFILSGSVQWLKGHIRIWVRLNLAATGEQLWAQTFERAISIDNYFEFQDTVVNQILASLMGLNGIISRYQADKIDHAHPASGTCYPIEYWFYKHTRSFNLAAAREAKEFYRKITSTDPRNALAYAYLSQINSGEALMFTEHSNKPLDEGLFFAHQSVKSDPYCQEGYLALATNLFFRMNYDEAVRALEQGEMINPKSNDYKGSMGALFIYMGLYDRGKKVLDSAFAQSPYLTWWHILAYSYDSFNAEHYQDAIYWAERTEMNVEQIPIIKAASYGCLSEFEKALEALDELEFDDPLKDLTSMEQLMKRFPLKSMAAKVQLGLRKLIQFKSVDAVGVLQFFVLAILPWINPCAG